jgi:hypothetical protein
VAAAGLVSLAGTAAAAGGLAEGAVELGRRTPRRIWARLGFAAAGERQLPVGPGAAAWTRFSVRLGPAYPIGLGQGGRWQLELHAEALLAAVQVRGLSPLRERRRQVGFDPGVGAGVRLGRRLWGEGLSAFVDVAVAGWPRQQLARADNVPGAAGLPQLEVLLGLGLCYGAGGSL